MTAVIELQFNQPDIADVIDKLTIEDLDELDFGVIGFDAEGLIKRYNRTESKLAGLTTERIMGTPMFTTVAPCMNNFMVAQRFDDAVHHGTPLDATIDYVLTLRMRPVKVKLRLLAAPGMSLRYVLVERRV